MQIKHTEISKEMNKMIQMLSKIRSVFNKTLLSMSVKSKQVFRLPSKKIKKQVKVVHKNINGVDLIEFGEGNEHYIYLHGGAYFLKGNSNHYKFIMDFCLTKNVKVTYIDYPVGCSHKETISMTQSVLDVLEFDAIIGDSAGGGLALSVETEVPLFLISPWLDLSLSNENIDDSRDFMFTKEDLLQCAIVYADSLNLKDPIISPLYKSFKNNISIYAGTEDILYHDMELFEQKNPNVTLHSFIGLPHVFPILTSSIEVKEVINDITLR